MNLFSIETNQSFNDRKCYLEFFIDYPKLHYLNLATDMQVYEKKSIFCCIKCKENNFLLVRNAIFRVCKQRIIKDN